MVEVTHLLNLETPVLVLHPSELTVPNHVLVLIILRVFFIINFVSILHDADPPGRARAPPHGRGEIRARARRRPEVERIFLNKRIIFYFLFFKISPWERFEPTTSLEEYSSSITQKP